MAVPAATLGASVAAAGFRKLVLYNTHGGNTSLVDVMARDLRAEFNLRTFYLSGMAGASPSGLDPQERAYGFHAGEVRNCATAQRDAGAGPHLRIHRELHRRYRGPQPTAAGEWPRHLRLAHPATIAPQRRQWAIPSPATAGNGARWIEEASTRIAAALEAMLNFTELV